VRIILQDNNYFAMRSSYNIKIIVVPPSDKEVEAPLTMENKDKRSKSAYIRH